MRVAVSSILASMAAATGAAAEQGYGSVESKDKVEVVGSGLHVEEDCKGRKADINGSDLVIKLTGTCAGVEVVGSGNRVSATVGAGMPLDVYGSDNEVEWRSDGEVPVAVVGPGNSVRQVRD